MTDWLSAATLAEAADRSRAIGAAWRASAAVGAVAAMFDAVDAHDATGVAAQAGALLKDGAWIETLLAPLIAALSADAAFQPPVRAQRDALRTGAVLLDHRAALVTATVVSADALALAPPAAAAVASGRLSIARYHRAGGARLRRWRCAAPARDYVAADELPLVPRPDLPLRDGMVVTLDGRTGATLLEAASADVAIVTVSVRAGMADVMREFALPSGCLIRAAAIDEGVSRTAMLLALLRNTGRADASDAFLAASRSSPFHLRWQAMREWLATDVATASPRFTEMAAHDPHPEVRAAARRTVTQIAARDAA